jgi:hypothetical protein
MKTKKSYSTVIATLLILLMASSMIFPIVKGDIFFAPGTKIPTYAYINVAPNPIGVGQTVNVNFFLSVPIQSAEDPVNMTVKITDPTGNIETKGPLTGDETGGGHFDFVPDKVGNWTFQFFYGGQVTGSSSVMGFGYAGLVELPSQSTIYTLVVQATPVTQTLYPTTPLPTSYWQTPVSAENVQNWYAIMGPWLGTGGYYNQSSQYNPYTESVLSGHVIWTKPWCPGGVVGGTAGGTETTGSYWSTRQYEPQYSPVIIDGRMYSTWYPETTGYSAGIVCTNLYTGQTQFIINTTNPLAFGMVTEYQTPNMYGVIGPYIWTTGNLPGIVNAPGATQYNMYSAFTGEYVLSVVNGASMVKSPDANGNLIGYYINSTVGTMNIYNPAGYPFGPPTLKETVTITAGNPVLCCFNMTQALWDSGNTFEWGPTQNGVIEFGLGVMWAEPIPTQINGVPINPPLALGMSGSFPETVLTGNAVVLSSGVIHGGAQQPGYLVIASMDQTTGAVLFCKNYTYPEYQSLLPFTNDNFQVINGLLVFTNTGNWISDAIDLATGTKAWETTLKTPYGDGTPNIYTYLGGLNFLAQANDRLVFYSLGGDIWAINATNGKQLWYTNTTTLFGNPGTETPYGVWPLWAWPGVQCYSNDVAYMAMGHEYDPPLFHGAQLLAINMTNGKLIWSELGFYDVSLSIAYGTVLSLNCYDNQIYAFAKGPSQTTVTAPDIGVTTATPITITGTVMDISPGTKQSAVALNFPNGVPCVSDASESHFMEYVYQQQPVPTDVTGVPVTLTETDHNGNTYTIGTTTSDSSGTWAYNWTPPISGNYTIVATFAGSNSYYGSCAETHIYASSPAATAAPTASPPTGLASTSTVEYGIVAVIIVIIIGIAVLAVLMLRKRP